MSNKYYFVEIYERLKVRVSKVMNVQNIAYRGALNVKNLKG